MRREKKRREGKREKGRECAPGLRSASRRREAGFTLLEVLISLAILVLAVATILPLFAVGTASHKRGIDQTNVSLIAPHILAKIQDKLYDPNPQPISNQTFEQLGRAYKYDATFAPLDSGDPYKSAFIVKVTVRWMEMGKEKSEKFETILLRRLMR